ncbi:M16 family metallopeptidase [Asticcacaulis endophyticus]|nr:insulinase family protein [Asticcacaulis endophyticus]
MLLRKTRGIFVFSLAVAMSTTALTTALAPVAVQAQAVKANPPVAFAQTKSDLTPDPAARFGKLPNGMTYVIYKNATPPGTAAVRLRFDAGSLMETDAQQGLAHFLEHMAFNGSKNVPEGEMVKILERHGLKFGPDTNAYTSFDETVYMLDLPKVDPEIVDTALMLMRETASNLLLDPKAIEAERGVIFGEERARASPGMRAYIAYAKAAFAGQPYPERLPIGQVEVIKTAPAQAFVDFYNDFYRPEYATLVIVGDINPDEIEAKIKAKFGDWQGKPQTKNALTNFGTYAKKGQRVHAYAEPGLPDSLSVSWFKPFDGSVETEASDYDDTLDNIIGAIVNLRLERQSKAPETQFAAASFGNGSVNKTAETYSLSISPKPGQDKAALEQALMTLRQFQAYGVSQTELDRVLTEFATGLDAAAKGEKTRNTGAIAGQIIGTLGDNEVLTSPTQNLAFFNKIKSRLTLEAINARIKALDLGDGPLIARQGSDAAKFDQAAIQATYQTLMAQAVVEPLAIDKKPWPYEQFGTPSKVIKTETLADLGVTQVTYANGLKVNIKPTTFKDNEVLVTIRFAGGLQTIAPGASAPIFEASSAGVFEGGLGKLEAEEIKETLAGKIYGLSYNIGEDSATLSGGTTKDDLTTQMQVLMAFTSDTAFRADAFERLKAFVPNYYTQLQSSPNSVFSVKAPRVIRSGDDRFGIPTQDEFLKTSNDEVKAFTQTLLMKSPVEITFVGSITVEEALKQIDATFATLAPRKPLPVAPKGNVVKFPTTNLHQVFTHKGREDQNLSYIAFPTTDFFASTQTARGLELLSEVMTLRLIEEIREKQGASYGSSASSIASNNFKGFGYIGASATVKPDQDEVFYTSVMAIVDDLKTKGVTEDELLRARKPVLDKYEVTLKTNGFWAGVLPGSSTDPRKLEAVRTRKAELEKVTAADLQKLAQTYLVKEKALRLQAKPEAK